MEKPHGNHVFALLRSRCTCQDGRGLLRHRRRDTASDLRDPDGESRATGGLALTSGGTHVAIERTGVYWRPVVNVREDHLPSCS